MKEVYELADALQWHEGMLLTPQHFQQLALRYEQLLHYHMLVSTPFFWGVRHVRIDPVLLLNGRFSVMELEAFMPDGLVVWHLSGEEALDLDLSPYLDELKTRDLTVHLAVPARRQDMNAFQDEASRYYSIEGKPVTDDNTGEGSLRIPRLKPRLKLLVGDEIPQKYTAFPLARLCYKNEAVALTGYIPPTLQVLPGNPLHEMSVFIATRVREKAAFLSERLRLPSFTSRLDKPMLFETQNIIQGLVTALPLLEAKLYAKTEHPYQLYLALCGLAGSVAGYAGALLPPVFPGYKHDELAATFAPVLDFIHKILDNIHETYLAIAFQLKDNRFQLLPQASWLGKHFVVGVRGKAGSTEAEVIAWMEEALISSQDHSQQLREKRVLGASRQSIDSAEELGLIPSKGLLLFKIIVDPAFISPDEPLEILNTALTDSKHRPAEIIFYAPNLPAPG